MFNLNSLDIEKNADNASWATKDKKGDFQILFWDFTYTLPNDSVNNQDYYIRDLPAKDKGFVKIDISKIPEGNYQLEIYKVGYNYNDPYTSYFKLTNHLI